MARRTQRGSGPPSEGERYARARAAAGYTQAEAAKRLGMDPMTLSRKERGVSAFSAAERIALDALYRERLGEAPSLAPVAGGLSDYSRGVLHAIRAMHRTLAQLTDDVLAHEGEPARGAGEVEGDDVEAGTGEEHQRHSTTSRRSRVAGG